MGGHQYWSVLLVLVSRDGAEHAVKQLQRVEQMNVVPDLLPEIDPVVELKLRIDNQLLEPGQYSKPAHVRHLAVQRMDKR